MSMTAALADHIDERTDAIIAVWRRRRRAEGGRARRRTGSPTSSSSTTSPRSSTGSPTVSAGEHRQVADAGAEARRASAGGRGTTSPRSSASSATSGRPCSRPRFAHAREHGFDLESLERAVAAINEVLDEAAAEAVRQFQEESRAQARDDPRRGRAAGTRGRRLRADQAPDGPEQPPRGRLGDQRRRRRSSAINREAERLQGFRAVGDDRPREPQPARAPLRALPAPTAGPSSRRSCPASAPPGRGRPAAGDRSGRSAARAGRSSPTPRRSATPAARSPAPSSWRRTSPSAAAPRPTWPRSEVAVPHDRRAVAGDDLAGRRRRHAATTSTRPGSTSAAGRRHRRRATAGPTASIPTTSPAASTTYRDAFARREPFEIDLSAPPPRRRLSLGRRPGRSPTPTSHGGFLGYLGSCLDITERVELEDVARAAVASTRPA